MFKPSEKELKKYHEWYDKHECKGRYAGAIGGSITWSFTPTGLGDIVTVKCNFPDCQAEVNLTDFDSW